MKVLLVYIGLFGAGISCFLVMILAAPSPETAILGDWQELTWEYEKVDINQQDLAVYKEIPENVKTSIGKDLIIHQAETWTFLPNGKLILKGSDIQKIVNWRIKGRGHILQLKYDNNTTEDYILTELDENKMHLNFETDIQARGIAKLTFVKNTK